MSSFLSRLVSRWPSEKALLLASVAGLVALAIMAASIIYPAPIVVVAGMSVAQLLGGAAFVLYLLSVAAEYRHDVGVAQTVATPPRDETPEKK